MITVLLLTAQIAPRSKKMLKNISNWQILDYFPFSQRNANKYYATGLSERERRMQCIAACRLDILWDTPEYVQFILREVLAWLNCILFPQYSHSHSIFSKNLRKVDIESNERKHHRRRRTRRCLPCLPPEKKTGRLTQTKGHVQSDLPTYQLCRNTHLVSLLVSDFHGKFMSFYSH